MVYLLMALTGLAAAAYAAHRDRRPAELAATFAVAAAGVILADWIAFGWFGLYTYRPHLAGNPQLDSALGELLADILFVPSLAVLASVRLPGLYGAVLPTFVVTAIEYLCLRYGLFFHSGWQTWYTAVLFPWYFIVVGKVRQRLERVGPADPIMRPVVRISLLFMVIAVYTLALRPFDLTFTNIHILPTQIGNQALGRFLTYPTVFVPVGYWVTAGGPEQRWWRLGAATALFLAINAVLLVTGFQRFRPPYTWYFDALGQGATLWLACLCGDLMRRHWSEPEKRAV